MANPNKTVAAARRRMGGFTPHSRPVDPFIHWLAEEAVKGTEFASELEARAAFAEHQRKLIESPAKPHVISHKERAARLEELRLMMLDEIDDGTSAASREASRLEAEHEEMASMLSELGNVITRVEVLKERAEALGMEWVPIDCVSAYGALCSIHARLRVALGASELSEEAQQYHPV